MEDISRILCTFVSARSVGPSFQEFNVNCNIILVDSL